MDQVKQQLAVVLKHGFWIGSAIVLLGSVGVWYMATDTLYKENESQTTKLNGAVQSVRNIRDGLPTQPNDLSHVEMNKLIDERKQKVLESWKSLYSRQQRILTWPTEELTAEFVDEFKDKIPIETHVEYSTEPGNDPVESYLRTQYQRYIGNALPAIAEIAKAEWSAPFDRAGAGAGGGLMGGLGGGDMGGGMMEGLMGGSDKEVSITGAEEGPVVKWSAGSQNSLLDELFPWRGEGKTPSTLEVYYSQENLWILKQLLEIVNTVNGDVRQSYQAKIHEIVRISIGERVSFSAGSISKPGEGMSAGGDMMGDMYEDMSGGMGLDGLTDAGTGSSQQAAPDPGDNRYVNTKNEPITGSQLRSALSSNSAADAEIAVAKRVPVMLSVMIDQRYIQQLLAACGSAPLMVDVRQVRVLPKSGKSGSGGMGGGLMGMGGMGEGMEEGGDGMGMGGMGMGGMDGGGMGAPTAKEPEKDPFDMLVEVYGLIYMYNPPDPVKLGVEEVDKNTVIEGITDGTAEPAAPAEPAVAPPAADSNDVLPTPAPEDGEATPPATTEPPAEPPADAGDAADPVAAAAAAAAGPTPALAVGQD